MIHHITRATRHLIFWGLVAAALALTVLRLLLSVIDVYKEDLEAIISREISAPVKIGHLGAGMRGFRPELLLKEVRVLADDPAQEAPITAQEIRLSMDLLKSYGHKQMLASSWITLVGAHATVIRHADGSIGIRGLKASKSEPPVWILHTAQFEILGSQFVWLDQMPPTGAPQKSASPPAKASRQAIDGLVFNDVNVALKSDQNGQRHALNMMLALPKGYGEALSIALQLRGNFLAEQGINGLIYAEAKHLQLAKLLTDVNLPLGLTLSEGQGNLRVWSYWQKSQLQGITGTTQLQQLILHRPAQPALAIKQLLNRFNWVSQNDQWKLRIDDVMLNSNVLQLENARLALQGATNPQNHLQRINIQAPQLDLQQAAQVGSFLGEAGSTVIPANAIHGKVKQLSLMVAPEFEQFSVQGTFDNVSLMPGKSLPGISNLSGHIQGDQQQGILDFALQNTTLQLPTIFAKPLPVNALQAHFDWRQSAEEWVITSSKLSAKVPDLLADSRLQLKINRQSHAVWMDLQSAFNGSRDIKAFGDYWPVGLMGKSAADWLQQAFLKGQVIPRGLLFTGALADFPFQHKEGVFELILDFKDIDLQYAADWEPVRAIDAEVLFYNDGIQISAQHATVHDARLEQFDISLPSFGTSRYVSVNLKGKPDIRQTLGYLQASPLSNTIERLLGIIKPKGLAPIILSINVPIVEQAALTINGVLQLQNVALSVLPLSLPVTNLKGAIAFNEQGLTSGQMQANALGNGIKISLDNSVKNLQLAVSGHTDIIDLQQQFPSSAWSYARGDADYRLKLLLPNDQRPPSLILDSDLAGIRLRLPDALAKSANEPRSFNLQVELDDQPLFPITLSYGKQLKAAAQIGAKDKKVKFTKLVVGSGEISSLPVKENSLAINLAQCSLADWWDLATSANAEKTASTTWPEQLTLKTNQVLWQGQALGSLDLQMQREPQSWNITLSSPLLKGTIVKPLDPIQDKPTILNLDYVNLSALSNLKAAEQQQVIDKRLPLLNIFSQQLLWNNVSVGSLELETERIIDGIAFKHIIIKNAQGGLNVKGSWTFKGDQQLTAASGTLKLHKFGDFLSKLNLGKDIKETDAQARLDVNWRGAPQHFALERLQGRVDVELKNGRILSIEPGFGRLLGFLAFEQWGRRLRLDFSDMLSKGLTFNSIRGRFDLGAGDAVTDNLVVDAIPAEVNIKGIAHLAERSLEYRAKVLPKSSAALPIAGTIVDRVLTFTLESITGNSQAGFLLGSEYKILGKWENPQVIRLRENDGLLQKTWYGLTDFSWLRNHSKQK